MSALDRLQNYSASSKFVSSEVFDVATPQGAFLSKLHSQGYKMYEYEYESPTGVTLSEEKFNWLPDEEKVGFERKLKYTELHNMLVAAGDQLVLANAGSGKALSNDTRVLTNEGYKPIGNLSLNDKVFGTDLQLHSVRGVFPQGKKRVNVMTIACSDSTYSINCCDEHLWAIKSNSNVEVISTKDVKRRLEDERSLPLVDLGSLESDMNGNLVLSDIECACILFTYFHLTDINDPDEFIDEFIDDTTLKFNFKRGMFDREYTKKLVNLLRTPDLKVKYTEDNQDTGWESYYFEYSPRFFDILKSKSILNDKNIKKSIDRLMPLLSVQDMDVLRIFDSGRCTYEITNVEETDSEVDMTCIEVDSDNHLFLIEGLIPTHNTTALIFKIMHDIITGEATKLTSIPNGNTVRVVDDIFVGTFLKTGADELAERLAYWQRGLGYTVTADRVNFSTLHAEFKRVLNTMGAATPIGKPADITKCMKKAIDGLGITREGSALTSEDYNVIGGIITYYRGRLDNKKYSHPSCYDYGLTPTLLDRLVSDFANQRQLAGIMDFEDLQELLYKFLYVTPNKAVQDFCANRYKYIYLDEFQDTSQIQYAIIKFYARGRLWMNRGTALEDDTKSQLYTGNETLGKIVVVGDNDQCVTGDTVLRMCYPYDANEQPEGLSLSEAPEYKPISEVHKGDYVCCADNNDHKYWQDEDEPYEDGTSSDGMTATKIIEEPIVHKRRNIDLYKITVSDYTGSSWVDLDIECSGDHILFTDDKKLSIPNEVYNTLIEGTGEGSTERGFFVLETRDEKEQFTMVYAKDLSVGDNVLIERYAGNLILREIISIEKVHYDEVDLYDIHTDARNYSANNFISHNCLYQWRGSDNAIIENEFDSDFRPCHSSLSYNYRCPSNILNPIVPSIKINEGHERREYHSSREGGISRGYYFNSYKSMLNQLLVDIDEDMQEGNTVAVLCRTNYDGVIPALILEANKHYEFSISGQNMTFDSPLPRKLIAVTSLFTERSSPAVKNTLSMFVPRFAEWGVKQLVDTLKNNGKNVWQIPESDIEYSCPELAPMIKHLKSMFYEDGKRNQKKEIDALRFAYHWIMSNTFGGASLYCESARAYIEALLFLIDNNEFESVFDFLDYVDTLNERLHARIGNQKAKICIATVHEFKGKERDSVIIWNDSEGVFPSSKTNIDNKDELEGERMVHYVACTRARKKNTIYTIYGRESIFVKEMDLQFESPQQIGGTLGNKPSKELTEDEKNLLEVMKNM